VLWSVKGGNRLYISDALNRLWGHGYCLIGDVTFDSAAYVARYIVKKVTGHSADRFYAGREPEYVTMSRRPGIAHDWFVRYMKDVLSIDSVIVNGHKARPPKYYDKMFDLVDSEAMARIKSRRRVNVSLNDNGYERLAVRERCTKLKLSQLSRRLEALP